MTSSVLSDHLAATVSLKNRWAASEVTHFSDPIILVAVVVVMWNRTKPIAAVALAERLQSDREIR